MSDFDKGDAWKDEHLIRARKAAPLGRPMTAPDLDAARAMLEGVTRYGPASERDVFGETWSFCEQDPEGDWVRFSDYTALAAEVEANRATIAALEARVEKLTGVLAEIAALDDNAECCGQGVCGGYSPPECCGQPEYGLDRAHRLARADLSQKDTP